MRPPAHTTVVFVCGALDMRRRAVKRLMSKAQVVNCGVIENEADAERWVKVRAARDRDQPRSGDAARARRDEQGSTSCDCGRDSSA